jgi:menaquinone-dependent protoporphyrinogen oxidase
VPKDIAELEPLVHPRGHRVFFGAFDHTKLGLGHKLVFAMPAMKRLMVDGDYRDWKEIDAWADEIANALAPVGVS